MIVCNTSFARFDHRESSVQTLQDWISLSPFDRAMKTIPSRDCPRTNRKHPRDCRCNKPASPAEFMCTMNCSSLNDDIIRQKFMPWWDQKIGLEHMLEMCDSHTVRTPTMPLPSPAGFLVAILDGELFLKSCTPCDAFNPCVGGDEYWPYQGFLLSTLSRLVRLDNVVLAFNFGDLPSAPKLSMKPQPIISFDTTSGTPSYVCCFSDFAFTTTLSEHALYQGHWDIPWPTGAAATATSRARLAQPKFLPLSGDEVNRHHSWQPHHS